MEVSQRPIPPPHDDDDEDVHWALSTAAALWERGERDEALRWLRRAAEQASDANADMRALELFKAAAEVATKISTSDDAGALAARGAQVGGDPVSSVAKPPSRGGAPPSPPPVAAGATVPKPGVSAQVPRAVQPPRPGAPDAEHRSQERGRAGTNAPPPPPRRAPPTMRPLAGGVGSEAPTEPVRAVGDVAALRSTQPDPLQREQRPPAAPQRPPSPPGPGVAATGLSLRDAGTRRSAQAPASAGPPSPGVAKGAAGPSRPPPRVGQSGTVPPPARSSPPAADASAAATPAKQAQRASPAPPANEAGAPLATAPPNDTARDARARARTITRLTAPVKESTSAATQDPPACGLPEGARRLPDAASPEHAMGASVTPAESDGKAASEPKIQDVAAPPAVTSASYETTVRREIHWVDEETTMHRDASSLPRAQRVLAGMRVEDPDEETRVLGHEAPQAAVRAAPVASRTSPKHDPDAATYWAIPGAGDGPVQDHPGEQTLPLEGSAGGKGPDDAAAELHDTLGGAAADARSLLSDALWNEANEATEWQAPAPRLPAAQIEPLPAVRVAVLGVAASGELRIVPLDGRSPPPGGSALGILVPLTANDGDQIAQLLQTRR